MSSSVTCRTCGRVWPREPAREVPCPMCGAEVGQQCKRPSGHRCETHADRGHLAREEVDGYAECMDHKNQAVGRRAEQTGLDAFGGGAE